MRDKVDAIEISATNEQYMRLDTVLSLSPTVIYTCKPFGDYGITFISSNIREQFGYEPVQFTEDSGFWARNIHPDDVDRIFSEVDKLFDRSRHACEYRFLHRDGKWRWVRDEMRLVRDREGRPLEIVGAWSDIDDRKRVEIGLRDPKDLLQVVIDSSPDWIFVKDLEHRFLLVNKAFASAQDIRPEDMIGRSDTEFWSHELCFGNPDKDYRGFHEDDKEAFAGRLIRNSNDMATLADGSIKVFDTYKGPLMDTAGNIYGVLCYSRDVTEQRQAEDERLKIEKQMLNAQKLESLGVLTGGIDHDFNNILAIILAQAEVAAKRITEDMAAVENIEKIKKTVKRAAELVSQMLSYAGRHNISTIALNINNVIDDIAEMLAVSVTRKISIRYNLTPSLQLIEADPSQISQVIMNLVINAADAIGDRSGTITISTGQFVFRSSESSETWFGEVPVEGPYVYLEVIDNGCGMDKKLFSKIFDPFFTTKFIGRGLGLSAVLGIVRGHNGSICIQSEPGKGTNIKVIFPATTKPEAKAAEKDVDTGAGIENFSGTILLADDETGLLDVGKLILESIGFHVITAENGFEAVEKFRFHKDEVICIILDLTMPQMDGEEAFHELRSIKNDIPIIISSGHSEKDSIKRFKGNALIRTLYKPYEVSQLVNIIRESIRK